MANRKHAATQEKLFNDQLAEMPLEYLICRDRAVGHKLEPATLDLDSGWQLGLVCERCGMEIEVYNDMRGNKRRRYWHPKGDFYFRGTGRLTPEQQADIVNEWRTEMNGILPKPS